jgi:hypothetical protein
MLTSHTNLTVRVVHYDPIVQHFGLEVKKKLNSHVVEYGVHFSIESAASCLVHCTSVHWNIVRFYYCHSIVL